MNYYIQGDAANADKIRAAFKAKGIYSNLTFANENYLYYPCGGKMAFCVIGGDLANIIKTHPDYQQLELPVEPKFNEGIWIVGNDGMFKITRYEDEYGYDLTDTAGGIAHFVSPDYVESNFHLWSIEDAKDGDVICTPNNNLFIYKCKGNGVQIYDYCGLYHGKFEPDSSRPNGVYDSCEGYNPATKEQRELLFKKMKEAGYQWDAEKKKLHKIKQHYDIANFHAGMPVLVRADDKCVWDYSTFSRIIRSEYWQFAVCNGVCFTQCIPFNKDTKRLLGTTDMPSEEYINW